MRVIILEPSAVSFDRTHSAKVLVGHTLALRAAGLEVEWITNKSCTLEFPGVPNHRILKYTIFDDIRTRHRVLKRLLRPVRLPGLVRETAEALRHVFSEAGVTGSDHIFLPVLDWIGLRAICTLYKNSSFEGNLPVLHILVMYENADWMTGGYPYRKIVRILKGLGAQLYIYTESRRHASSLAQLLGRTVSSFPFPAYVEPSPRISTISDYRVCFVGGGRRDKGYDLIPDIIRSFEDKASPKPLTFTVQAPRPEDRLDHAQAELVRMDNVEVLRNQLDEPEYQECLNNCSIMVFPYNHDVYRSRGSGIVNEAVARGIPVICTADTSLVEMIESGNGIAANGVHEFAAAITAIVQNYDDYSLNARKAAARYYKSLLQNALVGNVQDYEAQNHIRERRS